ncbi:GNAT family N-acetyltransferase [Heyndrickxia sp. MSNUG]|uniref:GNAT family N-acetyltransferase n=1 Tax=Heyndrickxia sp. MSNUG TaxID=3136677 RepID=UPI003C2DFDF6
MNIRQAEEKDAENFAKLIQDVENTSEYMLYGPGERAFNPESKKKMITAFQAEKNSAIFVAEKNEELQGFLIAKGGSAKRNLHTAYLVIGILEKHRGTGIGTNLFEELFNWAKEQNHHRLELTVMSHNEAGKRLYTKMGFEVEGTKRHSLLVNGKYFDENYMSKLI